MSKSFASKPDTVCPCCGREMPAHHAAADTRGAQDERKAARAAVPYGSATHTLLLMQQARELVRILLARKGVTTAQDETPRRDRKKLH